MIHNLIALQFRILSFGDYFQEIVPIANENDVITSEENGFPYNNASLLSYCELSAVKSSLCYTRYLLMDPDNLELLISLLHHLVHLTFYKYLL